MNENLINKRVLSGITATGGITLGNYIGAIKNFVKLQKDNELFIFVADLHALTIHFDAKKIDENRKNILALYIACGLDYHKSTIFFQSDVSAHAEMNWYVLTHTTLGELNRMTQFKDKCSGIKMDNNTQSIPTGLLIYPTLMTGDILLYSPDIVPVGIDQKQHLELTQTIAKRFNSKYDCNFKISQPYISKTGSKIMSLDIPTIKMSKSSHRKNSNIFLLDNPDEAYNKILKAITDSENKIYLSKDKPGIMNLLNIYASLKDISLEETEQIFLNKSYIHLKEEVATLVKNLLIGIQAKYSEAYKNIEDIRYIGAQKAQKVAQKTLDDFKEKIGFKK